MGAGPRHMPRLVRPDYGSLARKRPPAGSTLEAEIGERAVRIGIAPRRERMALRTARGQEAAQRKGGRRRNRKPGRRDDDREGQPQTPSSTPHPTLLRAAGTMDEGCIREPARAITLPRVILHSNEGFGARTQAPPGDMPILPG